MNIHISDHLKLTKTDKMVQIISVTLHLGSKLLNRLNVHYNYYCVARTLFFAFTYRHLLEGVWGKERDGLFS